MSSVIIISLTLSLLPLRYKHSFVNQTVPPVVGGAVLKFEGTPNLQSVTEAREMLAISKFFFPYIISTQDSIYMKKNSGKIFESIQIDSVTNNYYVEIPEWVINDFGWYEDTYIQLTIDGDEIIIKEREDD